MASIPTHSRPPVILPPSGESGPIPTRKPSLWQYFSVVRRHAVLLLVLVVLCTGVAAVLSWSMVPMYQAKASLELEVPPIPYREGDGASSLAGQSFDAYLQTQIGILESESLTKRVVDALHLEARLNAYKPQGLVALRRQYLPFLGKSGPITRAEAYAVAGANLKVRQARLNNLIEIIYNSPDPRLAADFVNSLCEIYAQQNLQSRLEIAQRSGDWVSRQLNDLRKKMENSEMALQDYRREHGLLLVTGENSNLEQQRLQQLQEELSRSQADRIRRQSQMEITLASSVDSIPQILDDAILKDLQIKSSELRRHKAELEEVYTAASPEVLAVEAQLASLDTAARKQRSSILTRLRNEYDSSVHRERSLRSEFSAQTQIVSEQNEKMIRHDTLKHEVDTNRATYEAVLQRIKQSSFSVALQATNSRVVDPPTASDMPYKPNHSTHLAAGLLSGILIGLASMATYHHFDTRVSHPHAVAQVTGARALGIIPSDEFLSTRTRRISSQAFRSKHLKDGGPLLLSSSYSPTAESFRFVATSILLSGDAGQRQILTVTSPGPNEGKTTVVSNLAVAFAGAGRRVLLVDADVRRPRLHTIFGRNRNPGLLELAGDGLAVSDSLDLYIQPTHVANLDLMASGETTVGRNYLSQMLGFSALFAGLRARYDLVLIDSPPIVCVPEARVLTGAADGVVMVIRSGFTKLEDIAEAEQYIQQDGGELIGTVLNDTSRRHPFYYGRYVGLE